MRWWRQLRARLKYRHFERDLQEELDTHRAMAEAEARRMGAPPEAVRAGVSRTLGNTTLAREASRAVWVPRLLEAVFRDARYGVRALGRQPSFTLTAVATLAVAVGLNAALLNVVSLGFLTPWKVPQTDRVVAVSLVQKPGFPTSTPNTTMPYSEFQSLRASAKGVELVAFEPRGMRIKPGTGDTGKVVVALYVSDNYFGALAAPPEKGRGFASDDQSDRPGVVISDRLWRSLFAGDDAIVGRVVRIDDVAATVLGVAGGGFDGQTGFPTDVYIPIRALSAWDAGWAHAFFTNASAAPVTVAARLRPGQTRATAQAELSVLHHAWGGDIGPSPHDIRVSGTAAVDQPGAMSPALLMIFGLLFAANALVLALACANLASLQLARSLGRRREIAVRLALGASRRRVVGQLMIECALLAVIACGPALALAWTVPPAVLSFDAGYRSDISFAPDWTIVASTFATCLATTLIFGLAPALDVTRRTSIATGPTALGAPRTGGWRSTALGVQVAIGLVLLVSATLLTRGVLRATSEEALGLRVHGVDIFTFNLPEGSTEAARQSVASRVVAAMRESNMELALADALPLRVRAEHTVTTTGRPNVTVPASIVAVSSSYFDVLDVPVVAGRRLSDEPDRHEVVVNTLLARLLWPDRSPIGQQIVFLDGSTSEPLTVVGVSADTRTSSPEHVEPAVYRTIDDPDAYIFMRNATADLQARVSALGSSIDPRVKVTGSPLADSLRRTLRNTLISAGVASAISAVALLLAAVGIFGVFAFMVEERRREIGIRMALGASSSQVIRAILGATRWAIGGGLAVGGAMTVGAGFVLRRYLLGMSPFDLRTYLTVAVILSAVGLLASYVPSRRAARVDPALTLRAE